MNKFLGKTIAIANQKGGVGKTTTTVNLSSYLAVTEVPVLLIDMDPQANATTGLGIEAGSYKNSVYDVLIGEKSIKDCIIETNVNYLNILPSSPQLVGAEIELVNMYSRESMLRNAIKEISNEYEFILIDSPPSLGLLTVNVLTEANSILIPIQCEYFALEGL